MEINGCSDKTAERRKPPPLPDHPWGLNQTTDDKQKAEQTWKEEGKMQTRTREKYVEQKERNFRLMHIY